MTEVISENNNLKNKIYVFFSNKKCLLSFMLGVVSYYMFLSYSGMAGGKYSPIWGDSLEIYIPAIRQFCRDILTGQSINYSWTNCMGMNTAAYNAYNVFSVTNILYLIFYDANIQIITCISLSIKAGLAALFFEYYFEKIWGGRNSFSVIISLCYAMSAYQVCFNLVNFIWMDGCFMLPLILYLLHNLLDVRMRKWLILAFAYLFVSNFYVAYIIGIFSFIYFCIIVIPLIEGNIRRIKCLFLFVLMTIISILVAAIVLVPTAVDVIGKRADDTNVVLDINMPIGGVVNQLFFGQAQGWTYSSLINVYCGVFVLLLVPFFFVLYRDSIKVLLGMSSLLVVLIISCYVKPLYLFWHAFDVPDGWDWRFSFLISFVLCVMAGLILKRVNQIKKRHWICSALGLIVYYICYGFVLRSNDLFYDNNTFIFALINIVLLSVYFILLIARNDVRKKKYWAEISVLIGALVIIELVANGYMVNYRHSGNEGFLSSEVYSNWVEDNEAVMEDINYNDFYRARFVGAFAYNTDTMVGINGVSDFFTIENPVLRNTLGKLGVATSAKVIEDFGYTYFTDMILGIKYKIYNEAYEGFNENDICIFDKALSIGYLVNNDVIACSLDEMDDFANINLLASAMAGYPIEIFEEFEDGEISLYTNGIDYEYNGKHVFKGDKDRTGNKLISLAVPNDGREAYVQFGLEESTAYYESPLLLNGEENVSDNNGRLSEVYIKKMDVTEYGNTITILMNDNSFQEAYVEDIYIAYYSEEGLDELYNALKEKQLLVTEFKDGYVKGNIFVDSGDVLFTTIPYESGWKVTANGEEVDIIPVINDTFIAVQLPEGEYEIEFKYTNPYIVIGMWISIVGLLLFALMEVSVRIGKRKEEI